VSTWATRKRRPRLALYPASGSPTLLFHKWHAYDVAEDGGPVLDSKNSRIPFLTAVAERANALTGGEGYERWHGLYRKALNGLDEQTQWITASTVWRLLAGLATNPALETGLTLHPLHGFPYLPGSAVRGLVRRAAESDLTADYETWTARLASGDLPSDAEISSFLDRAETVRTLFGSLIVESPKGYDPGWTLPLDLLGELQKAVQTRPDADPLRQRLDPLLGGFTGGLLTFYDAVPAPGQQNLLELDVLNPHYPNFYRASERKMPSDDQDPIPVYFLAVKAEAAFVFPFRLAPLLAGEPAETRDRLTKQVFGWLETALKTLGAGAKTAAGYGYFQSFATAPLQGVQSSTSEPK
jgi:CRISPR type III-B/RAMP module RAMP protein Cmr6